jgi:hypothetical protein
LDPLDEMVIPVPAGVSNIRVDFMRTPDRTLGNALSAASVSFTLILLWFARRRTS